MKERVSAKNNVAGMYDNITLFADFSVLSSGGAPHEVINSLRAKSDSTKNNPNHFGIAGFKVSVKTAGVFVTGSFPKFFNGNNLKTLQPGQMHYVLDNLGECLGFDIAGARVTSLEFGENYSMTRPVSEYLRELGDAPRLTQGHFGGSIYYKSGKSNRPPTRLKFYDKGAEAKVPGHLLRYEMTLSRRLSARLGYPMTASDLTSMNLFDTLLAMYIAKYKSIDKKVVNKVTDMDKIKTARQARDAFILANLRDDWQRAIPDFMDDLKGSGQLSRQSRYQLRQLFKQMVKSPLVQKSPLMKELDDKILSAGRDYL